ncbi:aminotransferase [Neoasaia chiangmaiensis NBRC 101099]|uniref:Aminotransferase n=1 Tax=Neoasaia chiangmaiensis TaxID=320497 RepID=A0A1U9KRX5_9PROT|nr:pyridoxal phosphate-dependent aminotransferase [Neoasaia chiangmaiensis]AQS88525.1 aminotransferase [Neoasaia chiangmaiensis]GBR36410.1 aminotransferase [Neoasaia chiangmaiensis NBRC 101099]GEN15357.1 aminotransferase [Neoasaia chiangmaiensis]
MSATLSKDAREELQSRGYSRRQFGRISSLLGMGAALTRFAPSAHAETFKPDQAFVGHPNMVRIGSNECWTGPFPTACSAGQAMVPHGNRYEPDHLRSTLLDTAAQVENCPVDHILPWSGSSDPLSRAVVSFCSPTRGLVTANPSYEAAWRTASWLNVKLSRVPLTAHNGYVTDVRAMLQADPNAGLYYICSPNNPTGTVTPLEDIAWLVDNKPAGSIVMVDEAYIHFSGTPSAISLVKQGKDVVVLRTFSKMFAMAGLRLGLNFARPDLQQRMMRYDGANVTTMLNIVALACGASSLTQTENIIARRNEMIAARTMTLDHLRKRGVHFLPNSQANMFMVDWKKSAAQMKAAFAKQNVEIGRNWEIWPTMSRVTVGSMADMQAFCKALDHIMA